MATPSNEVIEPRDREFASLVEAVLARGLQQTGQRALEPDESAALVTALCDLGREGGWALRFAAGSDEMPGAVVAEWVSRLKAASPDRGPEFAALLKQLLKACFQPAPETCRDSYRECDSAGRCRRQERAYDLARLSGAHCVDCPHWTRYSERDHLAWLGKEWRSGADELENSRGIYLPEDFRRLRGWVPPGQNRS
jgi:hypothetical protein